MVERRPTPWPGARDARYQAKWAGGRVGGDLDSAEGDWWAALSNPSIPADLARHRRLSQPGRGIADTRTFLAEPIFRP